MGVDHCVEAVRCWWTASIWCGRRVAVRHDELARPEFPVAELLKERDRGLRRLSRQYYMRKVAQIIESGILPLDKIVTDVIPASRYQEALDWRRAASAARYSFPWTCERTARNGV